MNLVFLNYTTEIFSPMRGGSLSTYIWEMCRCASRVGIEPWVITQAHSASRYNWPKTIYVPAPELSQNSLLYKWERIKRKISRWPHLRHKVYAERIAAAIRDAGLEEAQFVFQNDVELAIYLRRQFPRMFIVLLFQNYHPIKRFFGGNIQTSANVIAAVSRATGKWVEQIYRLQAGSVMTVHNGIDLSRFSPTVAQPLGDPIINFTGRICPEKGPDLLLRAGLHLSQRRTDFSLQFLGWRTEAETINPTPYEMELDRLAKELQNRGVRVRRAGLIARDDLPAELQKATIHVTPSRWEEPCAFVNLEAMAAGLAVVASRTGGTPEIIGDAGFIFTRDSVSELVGHLDYLLSDSSRRAQYAGACRERAAGFSWNHTWQKIEGLLASADTQHLPHAPRFSVVPSPS